MCAAFPFSWTVFSLPPFWLFHWNQFTHGIHYVSNDWLFQGGKSWTILQPFLHIEYKFHEVYVFKYLAYKLTLLGKSTRSKCVGRRCEIEKNSFDNSHIHFRFHFLVATLARVNEVCERNGRAEKNQHSIRIVFRKARFGSIFPSFRVSGMKRKKNDASLMYRWLQGRWSRRCANHKIWANTLWLNGNKCAPANKSKFLPNRRFMGVFVMLLLLPLELWLAVSVEQSRIWIWNDWPDESARATYRAPSLVQFTWIPTRVHQYRVVHLHHPILTC